MQVTLSNILNFQNISGIIMKRKLFIGSSSEGAVIAKQVKEIITDACGDWLEVEDGTRRVAEPVDADFDAPKFGIRLCALKRLRRYLLRPVIQLCGTNRDVGVDRNIYATARGHGKWICRTRPGAIREDAARVGCGKFC